jgi:hypothetical protein
VLFGRPLCHAPSRELVAVLTMSGLRAVVACRFPSPPPRGRTPCTPAREGRTLARHGQAEGHPTTRHCAVHRAHVVPRASVNRPSSCDGFVQGRSSHPSRDHAHPSARAMAIQHRCLFGMSRDAAVSRCGASTPRHVFLRAGLRAACFICRYVCAWSG